MSFDNSKQSHWRRWVRTFLDKFTATDTTLTIDSDIITTGDATFANDVIVTGDIIMAAGKGIDFSANANSAGMTSELLDDYEEGTWTPVISDGTNTATMVASTNRYTKVGRLVTFTGRCRTSSLTGSGTVSGTTIVITGLPFICTSDYGFVDFGFGNNLNIVAGTAMSGTVQVSTDDIRLRTWDLADGTSNITATEWSATGDVIFGGSYFTDS